MTLERLFHVLLRRRWLTALLLIGACIPTVQLAGKVRTDQAVEHMFPVSDPTRETYDAYKEVFPYDDAHAIVVMEADDLWTEAGLVRADRLEEEFRALDGVIKVDGPVSVRDVAGSDTTISLRRIFPRVDLPDDAENIQKRQQPYIQLDIKMLNVVLDPQKSRVIKNQIRNLKLETVDTVILLHGIKIDTESPGQRKFGVSCQFFFEWQS